MDCSPPGSSVHGISQARILEWVAISFPRGSFGPGIEPGSLVSPALAGGFFTTAPPGKPQTNLQSNIYFNILTFTNQFRSLLWVSLYLEIFVSRSAYEIL